ncbi:hypothetical protein T06_1855 [Trichinella sp. T6]|nr:hypothetical protein T06_1855 [Trichinella sp. T6]
MLHFKLALSLVITKSGKSESELTARFICSVASKEVYRELRLREPTTLVKARQLAENVAELEKEVGGSRQLTTENADAGNDNLARVVETLTRRFDQLQTTLERSNSRRSARRGTECFRCGEQGHFLRDCPQLQTGTRPARALNNGNGDRRLLAMTALQAGHAPSVTGKLNGLEISFLLDSGAVVSVVPLSIWHKSTGREPLEAAGGSILLGDGRRVRLCGQGTLTLQVGSWRGRLHVVVVESLVVSGILGTNFLDQYVKLIDWQSGEMTMTDDSRVRIIHEPAQATRPGIGCAWITASPREVSREETVGERPENNSGDLRACERALVDRAECSAQNRRTLRSLLRRYGKAISCGEGDLGRTSLVQHRIETGGAQPVKLPPRKDLNQLGIVVKMVRGLLQIPGNAVKIVGQRQRTKRVYEPIYMSTYDIPVAVAIKVEANRPAEASDGRPGRNGNPRKTSDNSTTKSTTQKGNLPVRDRRAATFFHSSVADRCPVCKASASPDVRKANNGQRRKLARKALICYKFRTLSELYIKI